MRGALRRGASTLARLRAPRGGGLLGRLAGCAVQHRGERPFAPARALAFLAPLTLQLVEHVHLDLLLPFPRRLLHQLRDPGRAQRHVRRHKIPQQRKRRIDRVRCPGSGVRSWGRRGFLPLAAAQRVRSRQARRTDPWRGRAALGRPPEDYPPGAPLANTGGRLQIRPRRLMQEQRF